MGCGDAGTVGDPPIACRLSGTDYRARMDWIARLNRESLLSARREGARLALRYRLEAAAEVDELIRRERACCPFFTFDRWVEADAIALDIGAPAEAAEAAAMIFSEILGGQMGVVG